MALSENRVSGTISTIQAEPGTVHAPGSACDRSGIDLELNAHGYLRGTIAAVLSGLCSRENTERARVADVGDRWRIRASGGRNFHKPQGWKQVSPKRLRISSERCAGRSRAELHPEGEIVLDPVRRRVERSGVEIYLTPREFDALHSLMNRAGRPVTHTKLLSELRGPGSGMERGYLRVLIGQLRKKLEKDPAQPEYILTDSYIGYRFKDT